MSKERRHHEEIELKKQQEIVKAKIEKRSWVLSTSLMVLLVGAFITLFIGSTTKHEAKEKELQSIVTEIQLLIAEEDYDNALIKANLLYDDTDWSSDSKRKWDETRESLIALINEKKGQRDNEVKYSDNKVAIAEEPAPILEPKDAEIEVYQGDDAEIAESNSVEYVRVIADTVRIRSSASTDNNDNIIGKASNGDKYTKVGTENDWSIIFVDGKEGYIKSEFLMDITQSDFLSNESVESAHENTEVAQVTSSDQESVNIAQQQEELIEQQAALLAQQQAAEALALQQTSALASNSDGESETWKNAQLNADRTVYVTPKGKKYHYDIDCAGKNARTIDIDSAKGSYGPCGTCVLR